MNTWDIKTIASSITKLLKKCVMLHHTPIENLDSSLKELCIIINVIKSCAIHATKIF